LNWKFSGRASALISMPSPPRVIGAELAAMRKTSAKASVINAK